MTRVADQYKVTLPRGYELVRRHCTCGTFLVRLRHAVCNQTIGTWVHPHADGKLCVEQRRDLQVNVELHQARDAS